MTGVNAVMVCVMASPITDRKVVVHLMPFVRRDSTVYELLQLITQLCFLEYKYRANEYK